MTEDAQPFKSTIDEWADQHPTHKVHYRFSDVAFEDISVEGNCSTGMVDAVLIETLVPRHHADYYFCGPKPFMVNMYQNLLVWGIPASKVPFEFFGPRQELEKAA